MSPKRSKSLGSITGLLYWGPSGATTREPTPRMQFKFPKNDEKYSWTNHVGRKMMFYGLSADRIKRVMRNPKRSEKGVAPETIAVMQPAGTKSRPYEIWVMYATRKASHTPRQQPRSYSRESLGRSLGTIGPSANRKVIITAWRYPGKSPIREAIPIPADILEELKNIKY
ncbi:MAG: hypothetical protein HYT67_00320 [Candidatus Yanofskybacteria bacterium]|nr:hypothetical protein [Candidatus Yanofskybacteria bacterium]